MIGMTFCARLVPDISPDTSHGSPISPTVEEAASVPVGAVVVPAADRERARPSRAAAARGAATRPSRIARARPRASRRRRW